MSKNIAKQIGFNQREIAVASVRHTESLRSVTADGSPIIGVTKGNIGAAAVLHEISGKAFMIGAAASSR